MCLCVILKKKDMSLSWSNDVVLEFLDLYRNEQLLWDAKHPFYRNRSEINNAWLRIQASLSIQCSVIDLKKKKESLMTSFRMHWNKKRSAAYHTNWFAYSVMENFLGEKYENQLVNEGDDEVYTPATYSHQPATPEEYSIQQNANIEEKSNQSGRKLVSTTNQSNLLESKSSKSVETEFSDIKKQVVETVNHLKKAVNCNRELDEYDLYGQLLAKKLRKLDERQRDVAMHEIDNIMFRAKMKRQTTPQASPSETLKTISPIFIVTQPNQQQYEDENPL